MEDSQGLPITQGFTISPSAKISKVDESTSDLKGFGSETAPMAGFLLQV